MPLLNICRKETNICWEETVLGILEGENVQRRL